RKYFKGLVRRCFRRSAVPGHLPDAARGEAGCRRGPAIARPPEEIDIRGDWMRFRQLLCAAILAATTVALTSGAAIAQKKYDSGVTDTEIKIGNIMPYSGPASAYGVIGKTEAAYFKKINAEGGINGRKINFISYDDAYSPPKAVEQARKLVES